MPKGRLEAFSDGVIAILITIMVLELRTPAGTSWHALGHELPCSSRTRSASSISGSTGTTTTTCWPPSQRVTGGALWANLHLLFWLSLIPFSTAWMSEHRFPPVPTAVYGIVLLCAAIAYYILQTMLLRGEGRRSVLRSALGSDVKGKISPLLYCLGIGLSFAYRWLALAVYVGVALMWLVPDRRVERHVSTVPAETSE